MNKAICVWTDWNNRKGYGAVGWYRIVNPLGKAKNASVFSGENLKLGGNLASSIKNAEKMKKLGNIWWFKYVDNEQAVLHLISAKKFLKTKLIVDIDDDMFSVNSQDYAYQFHHKGSEKQKVLSYLIKNADAITVSTDNLKNKMQNIFSLPAKVFQNCIDTSIWKHLKKRKKTVDIFVEKNGELKKVKKDFNNKAIRIGWICTANHEKDAEVIFEPMKEILNKYENVEFWCIGWKPKMLDELPRTYFISGVENYEKFPKFLCELGLDISVAPLIKDEFNKSKSNIKWLESTMAGVPVVASYYEPYLSIINCKTGYLAQSKNQWVKYISWLIENKEKREEIVKNALKDVLEKYNVKDIVKEYELFIKNL